MDPFCLINDQSVGECAPNSMIDSADIAGRCMDGMKSLGTSLRAFRRVHGDNIELIVWKFDIQSAYRNLWVSPAWQAKQIISIKNM